MKERGQLRGVSFAAWAGNINKAISPDRSGVRWRVLSGYFEVITDATVATRTLYIRHLSYDISPAIYTGQTPGGTGITAGLTRGVTFGPFNMAKGGSYPEADSMVLQGEEWLSLAGPYWQVVVSNGVAGDTVSLGMVVEEWID